MRRTWLALLAGVCALFTSGCTNWMARSLGAPAIAQIGGNEQFSKCKALQVSLTGAPRTDSRAESGDAPVIYVYLVNARNISVDGPSSTEQIYRVADVTEVLGAPYLGVDGANSEILTGAAEEAGAPLSASEAELRRRRWVLGMTLMSIADENGSEYWRRFSALMTYQKAVRASGKALMGSSIAATFVNPIVAASLAGAGLALDTFTDALTSNFDVEMYGALREAVKANVLTRRREILSKLRGSKYEVYPATSVIADVNDYAHLYSLRGGIDALKKVTTEAHAKAEAELKEAEKGDGSGEAAATQ
jgi:hypothetical protein